MEVWENRQGPGHLLPALPSFIASEEVWLSWSMSTKKDSDKLKIIYPKLHFLIVNELFVATKCIGVLLNIVSSGPISSSFLTSLVQISCVHAPIYLAWSSVFFPRLLYKKFSSSPQNWLHFFNQFWAQMPKNSFWDAITKEKFSSIELLVLNIYVRQCKENQSFQVSHWSFSMSV